VQHLEKNWIPVFTGMTIRSVFRLFTSSSSSQIRRKLMTKEQFMKLATFKTICRQLILVILVVLLQTGTLFTKAAEAA
jgi:hypothetical protein